MPFLLCIIAALYLIAGYFYGSSKLKNYDHLKHTISELGETGSAYEKQVGFGLFLPAGLLFAVTGLLALSDTSAMGLAFSLATGYIVAAFFPCDAGSPSAGSWKQQLHNLGGFIEYAGCIIFIMKAGENDAMLWFIPYKVIGGIVIVCIIITSIPKNPVRGLMQKIAELLLLACLLRLLY
ncbi:DUF998 domain-containing protein [Ferruginibacter sp.]